jgi:hypothetical protein
VRAACGLKMLVPSRIASNEASTPTTAATETTVTSAAPRRFGSPRRPVKVSIEAWLRKLTGCLSPIRQGVDDLQARAAQRWSRAAEQRKQDSERETQQENIDGQMRNPDLVPG